MEEELSPAQVAQLNFFAEQTALVLQSFQAYT